MKLCIPCARQCDDEHDTCPACGEASWMPIEREPAPEPQRKRGKRGGK